ncbi:MAG: pitrilysin family protein [Bowdeniella nasicola]|nr:pitrilysin family protein [Bowdeniella nasicola]
MQPAIPTYPLVQHRLDNGLTIAVVDNPTSPLAAINVTYRVGSRDEADGQHGLAHLFEHLMFQGSRHVAPGEHSSRISQLGGQSNASTDLDRTNYFQTVPHGAIEQVLWLEADRMGSMPEALSDAVAANERAVVAAEKEERANQPYGELWTYALAALFPADHPYHYPPIGLMEDLAACSLSDLEAFFTRHYSPANAVLTVAGKVEADAIVTQAERYFGGITARAVASRPNGAITAHRGEVHRHVDDAVPSPAVASFYQIPPAPTSAQVAIAAACEILTGGAAARMQRTIVREHHFAEGVQSFARDCSGGTSVAMFAGFVADGSTTTEVLTAMDAEIAAFIADGPSSEEVEIARSRMQRALYSDLLTSGDIADVVGENLAAFPDLAPLEFAAEQVARLDATAIQQAAASYLVTDNRAVIFFDAQERHE